MAHPCCKDLTPIQILGEVAMSRGEVPDKRVVRSITEDAMGGWGRGTLRGPHRDPWN